MAGFFGPNASLEMNPNNEINLNNVGTAALGCPGELARRAFGEVSDLGISGGDLKAWASQKDLPYPCESAKSVAKKKSPA